MYHQLSTSFLFCQPTRQPLRLLSFSKYVDNMLITASSVRLPRTPASIWPTSQSPIASLSAFHDFQGHDINPSLRGVLFPQLGPAGIKPNPYRLIGRLSYGILGGSQVSSRVFDTSGFQRKRPVSFLLYI